MACVAEAGAVEIPERGVPSAGCKDVQAEEVEVPDPGRGAHDQELEEPAVADLAQLQLAAPPAHHGHAPAERSHGALVPHALPHAPGDIHSSHTFPSRSMQWESQIVEIFCVHNKSTSDLRLLLSWLCAVQVFASHAQFKDWFSNPLTGMVEGQEAVNKVRGYKPACLESLFLTPVFPCSAGTCLLKRHKSHICNSKSVTL